MNWAQFFFRVTLCPVIFDNSTWPGDQNASIWRMFHKISRRWFWDMATLTPLFWANYKFLWVSCIFGGKYVAKWYFLFSALVCYRIIQKWPKSVCQPCKKFKFFSSSNPCKNLTSLWYYTGFVIWHPYVPFFFHFVDTSKIATSTSFFNNKRGIFSS